MIWVELHRWTWVVPMFAVAVLAMLAWALLGRSRWVWVTFAVRVVALGLLSVWLLSPARTSEARPLPITVAWIVDARGAMGQPVGQRGEAVPYAQAAGILSPSHRTVEGASLLSQWDQLVRRRDEYVVQASQSRYGRLLGESRSGDSASLAGHRAAVQDLAEKLVQAMSRISDAGDGFDMALLRRAVVDDSPRSSADMARLGWALRSGVRQRQLRSDSAAMAKPAVASSVAEVGAMTRVDLARRLVRPGGILAGMLPPGARQRVFALGSTVSVPEAEVAYDLTPYEVIEALPDDCRVAVLISDGTAAIAPSGSPPRWGEAARLCILPMPDIPRSSVAFAELDIPRQIVEGTPLRVRGRVQVENESASRIQMRVLVEGQGQPVTVPLGRNWSFDLTLSAGDPGFRSVDVSLAASPGVPTQSRTEVVRVAPVSLRASVVPASGPHPWDAPSITWDLPSQSPMDMVVVSSQAYASLAPGDRDEIESVLGPSRGALVVFDAGNDDANRVAWPGESGAWAVRQPRGPAMPWGVPAFRRAAVPQRARVLLETVYDSTAIAWVQGEGPIRRYHFAFDLARVAEPIRQWCLETIRNGALVFEQDSRGGRLWVDRSQFRPEETARVWFDPAFVDEAVESIPAWIEGGPVPTKLQLRRQDDSGPFTAAIAGLAAGRYRLHVSFPGDVAGDSVSVPLVVEGDPDRAVVRQSPDMGSLRRLAELTSARLIWPDSLEPFAGEIVRATPRGRQSDAVPVIRAWVVLLAVVGLLTVDWSLLVLRQWRRS